MRIVYTLLLALLMPLILARLCWRSLAQRGYREHIFERFGFYRPAPVKRCIWIHAVSVGETRAAAPLIHALRERYPTEPILLTSMTPTGRATAQELFGEAVIAVHLPYDFVSAHRRLAAHFAPLILLILETELWPNLLFACKQLAIPVVVVNARLSEKSYSGYARFAPIRTLASEALQSARMVAAQSAADAARFRLLGVDAVSVTGNIKFDVAVDAQLAALGERWRGACRHRQVLLCASTREGEEALLLAAYTATFDEERRLHTLLVIVPRHPQRFDGVAQEINKFGLDFVNRSDATPDTTFSRTAACLLGDSMGEMAAYLAFCDVAIIGGSFMPLGGHNLIEACALAKRVIMGPSVFNFADASRQAREVGALEIVEDAAAAMRTALAILEDSARAKRMGDAGLALVDANRGATEKMVNLVADILEKQQHGR